MAGLNRPCSIGHRPPRYPAGSPGVCPVRSAMEWRDTPLKSDDGAVIEWLVSNPPPPAGADHEECLSSALAKAPRFTALTMAVVLGNPTASLGGRRLLEYLGAQFGEEVDDRGRRGLVIRTPDGGARRIRPWPRLPPQPLRYLRGGDSPDPGGGVREP